MADTKKPNFAAGLKAQAKPAASEEDEKIIVDLGDGIPTPMYRGKGEKRMDDASWARLQKRAVKELSTMVSEDSEAPKKGKGISWGEMMSLAQDVKGRAKGLVSAEEAGMLEKMGEWDRAEFLRQRMQKRGYKVPINSAQDERASVRGDPPSEKPAAPYISQEEMKRQTEQYKSDKGKISKEDTQGSPEEWKGPDDGAPARSGSTQQEMSPVSSAGPGMSPRANMQEMMMGATPSSLDQTNAAINGDMGAAMSSLPSATKQVGPVNALAAQIAEDNQQKGPVGALAGQIAEDNRTFSPAEQLAIGNANVQPGPPSAEFNVPDVRDVFPNASALSGRVFNTDPVPAGTNSVLKPADVTQGSDALLRPGDTTVAQNAGMSASVSSKTPGKGNYPAPPPDTYVADSQRRLKETEEVNRKTLETQRKMAADEMEIRATEQVGRAEMEKAEVERQGAQEALTAKYVDGLQQLKQQVVEASKETVDPNRYWNNKSDGQKAMAVVAGALFGFTGQGMQWLQRLDGLVQNDMQAQAADLARKRGLLSDASGLQNNLVAQAEAKGLRGQAAYKAAVMAHKEDLASQIEMNAMNYADPILQQKAMQASIDLKASASKDEAEYMRQHALDAANINKMHADAEQSRASAYAARVAANKPDGLDKVDAVAADKIAGARAALKAIEETRALLGNEGVVGNTLDEMGKNIGESLRWAGMGSTAAVVAPDTSDRMNALGQLQEIIYKGATGEAIMKDDRPLIKERSATPGFSSGQRQWLDSMEQRALDVIAATTKTQTEAGRDTKGMTVDKAPVKGAQVTGGR